jgi:chemotaxis protein methyltransferase CheR
LGGAALRRIGGRRRSEDQDMNVNDFELIADILKERSGFTLAREKAYLLESRLSTVARKWKFKGFEELAVTAREGRDEALLSDIVQAVTITETHFFRDRTPFFQFRDLVLPHLLQQRAEARSLRIWSAGCSSGQEAYSLAMMLEDRREDLAGWTFEIVGTDLSIDMLARAKQGLYTQLEVQRGLPIDYLVRYFEQENDRWRLHEPVRKMTKFQPFNLLDDMSSLGRFDVVFCRYVLGGLGSDVLGNVLEGITDRLNDDGVLCVGFDEMGVCMNERLQPIPGARGLYGLDDGAETDTRMAS